MKITRVIKEENMRLVGKMVNMGKFSGLGYELRIGDSRVVMCGKAKEFIGVELEEGEEISIKSIQLELEK